jgi:hypothetical protein
MNTFSLISLDINISSISSACNNYLYLSSLKDASLTI